MHRRPGRAPAMAERGGGRLTNRALGLDSPDLRLGGRLWLPTPERLGDAAG